MRTQGSDTSIGGQLRSRGLRPAYSVDSLPGMPTQDDRLMNAPTANDVMGGIPPALLQQIQDLYASGDMSGAMQILTDHVGSQFPQGNMLRGRIPNPQRRARRQKMREDRMARRGAIKPKPSIVKAPQGSDGYDMEPDSDVDDSAPGSGPTYGGHNEDKSGQMPYVPKPETGDPNKIMAERGRTMIADKNKMYGGPAPVTRGRGGDPDRRAKLMQYFSEMGMK